MSLNKGKTPPCVRSAHLMCHNADSECKVALITGGFEGGIGFYLVSPSFLMASQFDTCSNVDCH